MRENHPDSSKAEIQKVQKTVKITDYRSEIQNIATHSLRLISSTGKDSRHEQKISTAIKKDLVRNTTDIPVVRQRQAPRTQIFHCFSTLTRPSMSQLQNNAEKDTTETARRLHDKVQRHPDGQEAASAYSQDREQETE